MAHDAADARAELVDLNAVTLGTLYAHLESSGLVERLVKLAYAEDLGPRSSDVTSELCLDGDLRSEAFLVARVKGVVAGLRAVDSVLRVFAPDVRFECAREDGQRVNAGAVLGRLEGPARQLLSAERTLLNIIGRLSGIASRTARFRDAIEGHEPAKLYDTRKTTPGFRVLEKYAVRCGGGCCHRLGLYDAMLIKDNHLAALGVGRGAPAAEMARAVEGVCRRARSEASARGGIRFIEVEVDSMEQFQALLELDAGLVDIVLLDNMPPPLLREAVRARDASGLPIELEASGGLSLGSVADVAATGVDRLSVGSLTHGAASLDVALDMDLRRDMARGGAESAGQASVIRSDEAPGGSGVA